MQDLTPEGQAFTSDLARRYGVSTDAVLTLLDAIRRGHGNMAQFSHPDLGGMGQWSQGGMIMVGDMFNNGLKSKVDGLCSELANRLRDNTPLVQEPARQSQHQGHGSNTSLFVAGNSSGNWWPEGLGQPSSTGAQNDLRYAWFPESRRLALQINGRTTLYDTQDHQIGGVSQQQGGDASWTFTSQHGTVRLHDLPQIPLPGDHPPQQAAQPQQTAQPQPSPPPSDDALARLERLAQLRQQGHLTDEEFTAAKSALLKRM